MPKHRSPFQRSLQEDHATIHASMLGLILLNRPFAQRIPQRLCPQQEGKRSPQTVHFLNVKGFFNKVCLVDGNEAISFLCMQKKTGICFFA